jgi:hypothetical protein
MLLDSVWLRTDLDADGADEYLLVLNESSGGSGSFRYLAVMKATADGYANVATTLLGDRLQILEITSSDDAQITVTVRSRPVEGGGVDRVRWRLLNSELTAVSEFAGHLTLGHEAGLSTAVCHSDRFPDARAGCRIRRALQPTADCLAAAASRTGGIRL